MFKTLAGPKHLRYYLLEQEFVADHPSVASTSALHQGTILPPAPDLPADDLWTANTVNDLQAITPYV